MSNWLENVVAKSSSVADWRLIGSIGQWQEINSKDFNRQLSSLEAKYSEINMILHSAGGSIYEGLQLYNRTKKSKATIRVDIEGLAASMASILAMASDKRRIARYGRIMVHQGQSTTTGSGNHLIRKGEELNAMNHQLAEIYAEAIEWKHPDRDARWVMENWLVEGNDKWFTADEALEAGLVHEVYDSGVKGAPATASFDEMVAFYDNSLTSTEPEGGVDDPDPSKNSKKHTMKKEQLVLMLAKHGITFEDTIIAEGNEEALINALSGKIKEIKAQAAKADQLQASLDKKGSESFQVELTAAQKDGRITTKQIPHYEKIAEKFGNEEAIAALKEIELPSADIRLKPHGNKPVDAELTKEREAWNYQAWEENDPEGLIDLADTNPEKYQEVLANYDPAEGSNAKKSK